MKVRLIAQTTGLEEYAGKSIDEIIVGQARLSTSRAVNELFDSPEKLIRHCIQQQHWSIFALANLTFEITTSRAIGRELLRHWSIRPQERSQRYIAPADCEEIELREQAHNNRQSSLGVINDPELNSLVADHIQATFELYEHLISRNVARETARFILPEATQTTLIMNGTVREWITALNLRLYHTAQKEIRQVAEAIRDSLIKKCPIVSSALFNFEDADRIYILDRVILEKYGVYEIVKANNFKKL